MNKTLFIEQVLCFTKLPLVQSLIEESCDYANFLNQILKKQDGNTTALLPKNEAEFKEDLETKRRNIIDIYKTVTNTMEILGFHKENINKRLQGTYQFAPGQTIRQFFAIIRNKEKRLEEMRTLQHRRDEMQGLKNHVEIMNNLIIQEIQKSKYRKTA